MYLITKHITRFDGFHSDIVIGYVETQEEAKKCINELNKAAHEHNEDNMGGIGQYLYKKIEKLTTKH